MCACVCVCAEQRSIVVEDLSPLAMYALRKANLARRPPTPPTRHDEHEHPHPTAAAAAAAAAANDDDDADQPQLTDDDIKVTWQIMPTSMQS